MGRTSAHHFPKLAWRSSSRGEAQDAQLLLRFRLSPRNVKVRRTMDEGSSSSSTTASTVATTPTTARSPTMVTGVGSLVNAIARAVQSGISASMEELGRTIDDKIQADHINWRQRSQQT